MNERTWTAEEAERFADRPWSGIQSLLGDDVPPRNIQMARIAETFRAYASAKRIVANRLLSHLAFLNGCECEPGRLSPHVLSAQLREFRDTFDALWDALSDGTKESA